METPFIELGQLSIALYFGYFVLNVPVISLIENTLVNLSFGAIKNTKLYNSKVRINNHSSKV